MSAPEAPAPKPPVQIDAPTSGYRPVEATFRGETYLFGQSALGVYRALNAGAGLEKREDEAQTAYVVRILEALPELVALLCPSFPPAPWGVDEEMALFGVVTEVLTRAGEIRFSPREG